jgi:hypothetical protein
LLLVAWLGGTAQAATSNDSLAPLVTGFTPASGIPGTLVIVDGSNLVQVVSVDFAGVAAPVYGAVDDGTAIQTQVPANAVSGPITVVTPHGSATSGSDFQVSGSTPPTISSFSPESGPVGTEVTFQGSSLVHVSGVSFNGADAVFSTFVGLTAFVPTNATSGPITVTTQQGSVITQTPFTVTGVGLPAINSFAPSSGYPGVVVSLIGTNFEQVTAVLFGGVPSSSTTLMAGQLWAEVPVGAQSGPITVQTATGQATTADPFVVTATPTPAITDFSPTAAKPGEYILLHGTNLVPVQVVTVHDVPANVSVLGPGELSIQVPYAPSGPIAVQTSGGKATSAQSLTVIDGPMPPAILSFTPTNGLGGMQVTLHGTNLGVIETVLFNNVAAEFSHDNNDVVAIVPDFAQSGPITVKTSLGNAVTPSDFVTYNSGGLGVLAVGSPDGASWEQPVTFSVTITNLSGSALTNLVVTNFFSSQGPASSDELLDWSKGPPEFLDQTPAAIDIQSVRSSQGTVTATNGAVLGNLGELPVAGFAELTLVVALHEPQTLVLLNLSSASSPAGGTETAGSLASVLATGSVPLSVIPASGGQIEVSWSNDLPGLILQSADSLLATAQWKDVPEPVQVVNGRSIVLIPTATAGQFFRLVQRGP